MRGFTPRTLPPAEQQARYPGAVADDTPGAERATSPDSAMDATTIAPVDADGVGVAVTGTCMWVVAGIVLWLGFGSQLRAADAQWWLWVCAIGALLGLVGLTYVLRRRAVYRSHALRTAAQADGGQSPS